MDRKSHHLSREIDHLILPLQMTEDKVIQQKVIQLNLNLNLKAHQAKIIELQLMLKNIL